MKKRVQKDIENLDLQPYDRTFLKSLEAHIGIILTTLNGLESAFRQSHPPLFPKIRNALQPFRDRLSNSQKSFIQNRKNQNIENLSKHLDDIVARTEHALHYFFKEGDAQQSIQNWMKSMRQHCRALESLYPLHRILKPVNRYFLEPEIRDRQEEFIIADKADTGFFDEEGSSSISGGFTCFVPETYDGTANWPLVIALHGGYGSGRDFIWYWLREARSRKFILVAPNSAGSTWSFDNDTDQMSIDQMIADISRQYQTDSKKRLLTGFSDGAIFTLILGLKQNSPFTTLAPISGVLHPISLNEAKHKRIYLAHGSWDWMFPVERAQQAADTLKKAGAQLVFKEVEQLSHTYPREENRSILNWFDISLSL